MEKCQQSNSIKIAKSVEKKRERNGEMVSSVKRCNIMTK